jgi:hypothetical protein
VAALHSRRKSRLRQTPRENTSESQVMGLARISLGEASYCERLRTYAFFPQVRAGTHAGTEGPVVGQDLAAAARDCGEPLAPP